MDPERKSLTSIFKSYIVDSINLIFLIFLIQRGGGTGPWKPRQRTCKSTVPIPEAISLEIRRVTSFICSKLSSYL